MGGQFMKGVIVGAVVAAVVTTAGTALAGKGVGAVFNLGTKNTTKATTTLITKGSGPALKLRARSGVAALAVNTRGLVEKLNADLLDGKHASEIDAALLNGKPAAELDVDKLDGLHASEIDADKLDGLHASEIDALTLNGQSAEELLAARGSGGYVVFPVASAYKVTTVAGFGEVWASPEDGGSVYMLTTADIYNGKVTIPSGAKMGLAANMDAFDGNGTTITVDMLWAGDRTATEWRMKGKNGDAEPQLGFQFIVN